ncbi:Coiled-coil domain-containing protein 25, partial [Acropora cervicornis]
VTPPYTIFMGADKHEIKFYLHILFTLDEDLIKWGFPEDVWFHVDKMSSAHVYLRLRKGETLDDVPSAVLTDCAQLVKANSIHGINLSLIQ